MIPPRDFALEVYFSRWEFSARYHLTASDAQTMTIGELLDLAGEGSRSEFESLPLGYTSTWGTEPLREAVARTYERVGPDNVLCFTGAQEPLYWAMQEFLGSGDHAIVTVPNYQSMETIPLGTGAEVTGLLLDEHNGWALDLDLLRRAIRPTTRLVAVNFPNNPTGYVPDAATFRELVELCDERGIQLFCDEVYRGLELDPARTLPQAADLSERAISLNVMSKAYGLAGLRIGWLACRERTTLERLERRKHYTSICNSAPSEYLATIALRSAEAIKGRNRATIKANLPAFSDFFASWSDLFDWEPPAGGCVCFPRYNGADGVEKFCRELVEQAGVLLLPSSIYRSDLVEVPRDHFRVGVGRSDPAPALEAFDRFLERR